MSRSKSRFNDVAEWFATQSGRPVAFVLALAVILIWLVSGPLFRFSDTWQLIINTSTTIITFLMVFLIQNSQNRDTRAIHIKLDELLRATRGAHVALLDLEKLSDQELDKVRQDYERLAADARRALQKGHSDTNVPEVRCGRVS